MNRRPNTLQKMIHRVLMLKPVSALLAVFLYRADEALLHLTRGRHTVTELVGLPIIELTTIGAKSGQPRTMPLVTVADGERLALIASNFGRRHNPGWYYNLKANPECTVRFNGYKGTYLARQAMGEEYEKYWQMAISYYAGYAKYKERAAPRAIPIIVLEKKESPLG